MLYILKHYIFMRGATRGLKISAVITVAGIALSTAVLVISLSVASGFESAYKRSILDFNAHIVLLKENSEISGYFELMNEVKTFEGVTAATPFIYRESMVASKGIVKGVVIKGVDFKRLPTVSNIIMNTFERTIEPSNHRTILLGKSLAEKLNISGPTEINLLMGQNKFQKISVTGTFESGLYDYDSQFILMSIPDVQALFGMEDVVTGIEMKTLDPDSAPLLAKMFEETYPYPFHVTHWAEMNKPIFEAVRLEKIMFAVIVGVLVLVGTFNVIGAIVLRILYKMKDISILAAIGMRSFFIRGIFTFHGTVLGSVGTILGMIIGLLMSYFIGHLKLIHIEPEIYFLSSLPVTISLPIVAIISVAGTLLALVVSYVAAGKIGGRSERQCVSV